CVFLAVSLAVAACGGGGKSRSAHSALTTAVSTTTASTTAPTATSVAITSTTARPATTTTAKPKPKVSYPAGGAVDPVNPPGDPAYTMLVQGNCQTLLAKTKEWDSKGVADAEGADT